MNYNSYYFLLFTSVTYLSRNIILPHPTPNY
jgi:hypothetical protein